MKSTHRDVVIRTGIPLLMLLCIMTAAAAQARPDLSGLWKQDNDRCQPKRSGDVTLRIAGHDPDLTVETFIALNSANSRRALQKYTTDGKVSISTGADGDEFHTSILWKHSSLVFSIEEHENGRTIRSKETWSVIDDGATLERVRERSDGVKQTVDYRRIPVSGTEQRSASAKAGGR